MSDVKEIKLDASGDEEFGIEELPSYEVALLQGCSDVDPY